MVRGNKFKPQAAAVTPPPATQSHAFQHPSATEGNRAPQPEANSAAVSEKGGKHKRKRGRRGKNRAGAGEVQAQFTAAPATDAAPQQPPLQQKKRKRGSEQQPETHDQQRRQKKSQPPAANGHISGKPGKRRWKSEQRQESHDQQEQQKKSHPTPANAQVSGQPHKRQRKNQAMDGADTQRRVELPTQRPDSDAQPANAHTKPTRRKVVTAAVKGIAVAGANWVALKAQLSAAPAPKWKQQKRQREAAEAAPVEARLQLPQPLSSDSSVTSVVAVDCEMVGVGPEGARSQLARVCIVNNHGVVLMDKFSKPKERVTDFRTRFSGIRPSDIKRAPPFEEVQAEAAAILKDRIVVGHSITNDLKALLLAHPAKAVRDTARYPPLMLPLRPGGKPRPRALRALAAEQLGLVIQTGEHSPVDDARASLYLYHKHRKDWERTLKQHGSIKRLKSAMAGGSRAAAARNLADLAKADDMVDL